MYDINKNEAKFVVVNKNLPILDEIKTNLESQYQSVQTTDYFTIYQRMNDCSGSHFSLAYLGKGGKWICGIMEK